jgi:hypothetical protein
MVSDDGAFDHSITEAATQLVIATKLSAFAAQAVSRQCPWEPDNDIVGLDEMWSTEDLPDPVSVYHRVSRAFLEGIADLLSGLTLSLQKGRPLLVSTANLARSIHEYSSRAAFLTDPNLPVNERLVRAAVMINDGFDNVGGKDPKAHDQVKFTASPFYDWYDTKGRGLTDRAKKFSKYVRSVEIFAETLGVAYQEPVYKELSNFAHGNGPALLGLYDAALRPDVDGPKWSAIDSFGRVFYALDCALVATRQVSHFTDPTDQRLIKEILPYLANAGGLCDLRPDALIVVTDMQKRLALSQWQHCTTMLEEARDMEK